VSEGVAMALPCVVCGHAERDHQWKSVNSTIGLTMTDRCAYATRLPRSGDEPNVRYEMCDCEQYEPDADHPRHHGMHPVSGFCPSCPICEELGVEAVRAAQQPASIDRQEGQNP